MRFICVFWNVMSNVSRKADGLGRDPRKSKQGRSVITSVKRLGVLREATVAHL